MACTELKETNTCFNRSPWGWEDSSAVKCVTSKHRNVSSIPRTHTNIQGMAGLESQGLGGWGQRQEDPYSLDNSVSSRLSGQKTRTALTRRITKVVI